MLFNIMRHVKGSWWVTECRSGCGCTPLIHNGALTPTGFVQRLHIEYQKFACPNHSRCGCSASFWGRISSRCLEDPYLRDKHVEECGYGIESEHTGYTILGTRNRVNRV